MVTLTVYFIEKKTDLELQYEHLLLKFSSVDYVLDGKLTNRWAKNTPHSLIVIEKGNGIFSPPNVLKQYISV